MASRSVAEKWLVSLTDSPTAPGIETRIVDWVRRWAARRPDLELAVDSGGNLFITQRGDLDEAPVLAVAHMDHPAFVIEDDAGSFEFRGGVDAAYFLDAQVHVVSRHDGPAGRVTSYDPRLQTGTIAFEGDVVPGEIAMWRFAPAPVRSGLFRAPACDDLAGVAAALAALDRARRMTELRHFGVMLTRAEEVGLVGAIHSARNRTIPKGSRLLSIETSRELPMAQVGHGPIIRIGDRATVFDSDLSNRICDAVLESGVKHQRKLMDGGGCEATAFGAYGYEATGLCLALRNWHNRGNLEEVESGDARAATPMLEEISLEDYHGLIDVLLLAAAAVDRPHVLASALDQAYESNRHYLG